MDDFLQEVGEAEERELRSILGDGPADRSVRWSASGPAESSRTQPSLRLTGDTFSAMSEVTIRDLRNHGGEVIDRVERGERLTVTRDGRQVAELRPLGPLPVKAGVLIERWSRLPRLDPEGLRQDLDQVIDASL